MRGAPPACDSPLLAPLRSHALPPAPSRPQGVVAHRVRGAPHADAVTAVAFNPLHPQMAVACLDGRVHFYAAAGGEG